MTPLFISLLAGLAHAAAMAAPWSGEPVWWLQLMAMGALVWQLEHSPTPRQAAWRGWIFSVAWLCGTFWWLYISMHTYGGLNPVLTVLAIVALAGALSLYYAAACWCFRALALANIAQVAIVFAALWTMAEMARGTWLTGFGWGASAYAQVDGLAAFAKYIGAYGVGALAAFVAAYLASAWSVFRRDPLARGQIRRLAPVALIGLLAAASNHEFSAPAGSLEVALLQGNIKQSEKFEAGTGVADALKWYGAQIQTQKAALIVAPETAIPLLPQQLPDDYWQTLIKPFVAGSGAGGAEASGAAAPGKQALLVGIPLGSYKDGYTNSVMGFKPLGGGKQALLGESYRYDKHHLVPFGEFIPPLFKWFTQMMNIPLGDFNRGAVGQPSFEWQGQRLAPNICYEDLFGEELGARFRDPATAPTIFVNVSNIGWFGNTVAIDQHRSISRMRALEFERPYIRATNTGDTVIIDYEGRVTHALQRHTRGVLVGQVQGRSGPAASGYGVTPFAWWVSRFGLWPYWILAIAIVLVAIHANRTRARA